MVGGIRSINTVAKTILTLFFTTNSSEADAGVGGGEGQPQPLDPVDPLFELKLNCDLLRTQKERSMGMWTVGGYV